MHTSLKVTLGYAFLILSLGTALAYIARFARSASRVSRAEAAAVEHRSAVNALTSALLEASAASESVVSVGESALPHYNRAARHTEAALQRLQQLNTDSLQRLRLDSLAELLAQKRTATLLLLEAARREKSGAEQLEKRVNDLKAGRDSITLPGKSAPAEVLERSRQVVVERTKPRFFARLGDAFRRAKNDTTFISQTERLTQADSLPSQVNISDTVAGILSEVNAEINRADTRGARRLRHHRQALSKAGHALTQRLTSLIATIEANERQTILLAETADRRERRVEALKMGTLAAATTIFAAILFIMVWRDLSRAKRYRENLESALRGNEALMKSREQLLLTISHDIKAPVGAIIGYLDLMAEKPKAPAVPPVQAPADAAFSPLAAIRSAAAHLLRLVQSLLEYHKLEAGALSLNERPFRLKEMLRETAEGFRPAAAAKHLGFTVNISPALGYVACADDFRLRQIIENVISNAVKYTAHGEISFTAEVPRTGFMKIAVADTGCGLTPAEARRAFTPYARMAGSEGTEGTGLGLTITQSLVSLMNGEIAVYSRKDEGTKVVLSLPVPQSEEAPADPAPEAAVAEAERAPLPPVAACPAIEAPMPGGAAADAPLVALIDDSPLQLRLSQAVLLNVDAEVRPRLQAFTDAEALLAEIERRQAQGEAPFAAVFTDIEMPSLGGFELLRRIRARHGLEALPVVAATAHADLPAEHFLKAGFTAVLFKPFARNDAQAVLSQIFRQSAAAVGAPPMAGAAMPAAGAPTLGNQAPKPSSDRSEAESRHADALDLSPLFAFAEGDAEAAEAIRAQFLADTRLHATQLRAALHAQNKPEATRLAHKLLPVFTLLASPAVPALKALDARRNDAQWLPADESDCREVLAALRQIVQL